MKGILYPSRKDTNRQAACQSQWKENDDVDTSDKQERKQTRQAYKTHFLFWFRYANSPSVLLPQGMAKKRKKKRDRGVICLSVKDQKKDGCCLLIKRKSFLFYKKKRGK